MKPKDTVLGLKRLIGLKYSDPEVQAAIPHFMFPVSQGPNDEILVTVNYMVGCARPLASRGPDVSVSSPAFLAAYTSSCVVPRPSAPPGDEDCFRDLMAEDTRNVMRATVPTEREEDIHPRASCRDDPVGS